jgi:hypothetical protein
VCAAPVAARDLDAARLELLRLIFQTQPRSLGCGSAALGKFVAHLLSSGVRVSAK